MVVAIFGNSLKSNTSKTVEQLAQLLTERQVQVVVSQELCTAFNLLDYPVFDPKQWKVGDIDMALSIGGDGTFLTTASQVGDLDIPILGINYGHLGFLADAPNSDLMPILDVLLSGKYTVQQRMRLRVSCNDFTLETPPYALNEIAAIKAGINSMIKIDVSLNGQPFHTYNADGLIVATPTGSTAYNLSVGGPIVVPHVNSIILAPIASHSLHIRPIIIPADWQIDLTVHSRTNNYCVSVDGRSQVVTSKVKLHIQKAENTIKLVQLRNSSFLDSLKSKLNWGI